MTIERTSRKAISSQTKISNLRKYLPQILAVGVKNVLLFDFGLSLGFPTILVSSLSGDDPDEKIVLDENGLSWIGSVNLLCVPLGCLLSGYITQPLGRKRSMQLVNLPFLAAWILFHFADKPWHVLLALGLTGASGGLLEAPTLTYLAEVTTPNLRGVLASTSTVAVIMGVLCQFFLGTFLDWRSVALVSSALPVTSFILLFLVPESPYWLISKNRIEEAQRSVAWLRGWVKSEDVEKDFKEIYEHLKKKAEDESETEEITSSRGQTMPSLIQKTKKYVTLYARKDFLWPFGLVVLTFALGHFSGMTTLQTYAVNIFATFNTPIDKYYATIILGVAEVFGCILSSIFVHFVGKRKMNFFSLLGTGMCFFVVATYAHTLDITTLHISGGEVATEQNWLPMIFLVASAFFSHTGIRILPWMLVGEVFYNKIRAPASGFSSAASYFISFLANKIFYSMISTLTLSGTFWFYSSVSILGLVSLYFWLPETEGKTLIQITEHFKGGEQLDNAIQLKKLKLQSAHVVNQKGMVNAGFENDNVDNKDISDVDVRL